MGRPKINIPKEVLDEMYTKKGMGKGAIAKKLNVSPTTVLNRLIEYNIETRSISEAMMGMRKINIPKKELEEMYNEKGIGTPEIARKLNTTSSTVRRYLIQYNIPMRSSSSYRETNISKEVLNKKYINEMKTMDEIAVEFNVSRRAIGKKIKKFGIPARPTLFGYKERLKCDDGHLVRSSGERKIDNFLYHNGITHEYETQVEDTKYLCDFYIPSIGIWIEYWGLYDKGNYNEILQKKLEVYERFGLKLIEIYPGENIHDKLRCLIPLCAEKQQTLEVYYLDENIKENWGYPK